VPSYNLLYTVLILARLITGNSVIEIVLLEMTDVLELLHI